MPMLALALTATIFVVWLPTADVLRSWDSTPVELNLTEDVHLNELSIRSNVYDINGQMIDVFSYIENRALTNLDDISQQVQNAVLAIEDENFYLHAGIDLSAVVRAGLENVGAGGITQGGSTLTQQLIKNLVVGNKVEAERKLREMVMARRLERELDKQDILNLYLNTVYFGQGAYGVQAAAEVYWGLNAVDLDWSQAALLAGMINNPSRNNPINNPVGALRQRRIVLNRLADLGFITRDEAEQYNRQPLPTKVNQIELPPKSYFVEEVKQLLLDDPKYLGGTPEDRFNLVFNSGLNIYTTFDPDAQRQAEAAITQTLVEYNTGEHAGVPATMALVAIEPDTGAVRALVGGPGFAQDKEEFNLATQGTRQPGSAFKTFVMLTLFEQGYQPSDQVSGEGPCLMANPGGVPDPYVAHNFARSAGQIETITNQIRVSSNCAFLRLGQLVGIESVVAVASRLGISADLPPVASLPLGSGEVYPIDMASAYGSIATGGIRYEPYYIERILDRQGNVLYDHELAGERVVSARSACWATEVLVNNMVNGTGHRAQVRSQPGAGKTGTTEESADAWFVGFTPYLATAVWLGNPNERIPLRGVTGSSYPALAWGRFMNDYHEIREPAMFSGCPSETRLGDIVRLDNVFTVGHPCADLLDQVGAKQQGRASGDDAANAATGNAEDITSQIVPVDTDEDGFQDTCVSLLTTGGLEPCGLSEFATEEGIPWELYCDAPAQLGAFQLEATVGVGGT
ncbi:MAG: hypothetical protein F4119_03015 [Acidimicrobiia bacterium]|nr:hypothetical protein [Acidimicrobiia bacterium]